MTNQMTAQLCRSHTRRLICWFAFLLLFSMPRTVLHAQELWFISPDNLDVGGRRQTMPDFMRLFEPDSEWPRSRSSTRVFGLNNYYATYMGKNEPAVLKRITEHIAERGIRLATAAGATVVDDECGWRVEGLSHEVSEAIRSVQRLKNIGAALDWIILDAPMNAHDYRGPRACNYSITDTVHRMAASIAEMKRLYPKVKISMTQVPDRVGRTLEEWQSELTEELARFTEETGRPLDALMLDMNYDLPEWQEYMRVSADILHRHGSAAGAFLDSRGGKDVTDESWMAATRRNIDSVIATRVQLDMVILATWARHPSHNLPETDPLALTSLLNWYTDHRSHPER